MRTRGFLKGGVSLDIRLLRDNEDHLWDALVRQCSSHYLDSLTWQAILTGAFSNIAMRRFVAVQDDDVLSGISLFETTSMLSGRKLTNAPFRLPTTFLQRRETDPAKYIEKIIAYAREAGIDQIKLMLPEERFSALLLERGFIEEESWYSPLLCFCGSHEQTSKNYKRDVRRKLRCFKRENDIRDYCITVADNDHEFNAFYDILLRKNQEKHITLPPPREFLRRVWTQTGPYKRERLYLLRRKGIIAAGVLIIIHDEQAWYALAAVDENRARSKNTATYFLDAILSSLAEERVTVRYLDLGIISERNEGLYYFKSRWGAVMTRHIIYSLSLGKKRHTRADQVLRNTLRVRGLIRHLPRGVVEKLSGHFYQYLV